MRRLWELLLELAVEILGYVNNGLYVALAAVALVQYRRLGGEAPAWLALTFVLLASVGLVGLWFPEDGAPAPDLVVKLMIAGIVFFPYCLYRFMTTFITRLPWRRRAALGATLAVAAFTLVLPSLPDEGDPLTTIFTVYLVALLLQWSSLLILVAYQFWKAGRGQPIVPRRRMKLLSLASIGMTLALVVAATASGANNHGVGLLTQLFAAGSVVAFFLGFAPPAAIRVIWRRREQDALHAATSELLEARTPEEVSRTLLPRVAGIVGANSVQMFDRDGAVLGSFPEGWEGGAGSSPEPLRVEFDFGTLLVGVSPHTPYFGRDEIELTETLGALAGLALERTELFEAEQRARRAMERANAGLAEANEELSANQRVLAEAQRLTQIGSYEWDVEADRVDWSEQMFRNLGLEPGGPVNYATYLELIHPEDRGFVEDTIARALQDHRPYEFDHRAVVRGEVRVLHARGQVSVDETGRAYRVHGTAQDVTELRRAENELGTALERERDARTSLEHVNAEMESFVYTVSHDLNSPLISILGFLEFLEKDYGEHIPEKGRFFMERMSGSARYMQSLIRDLLDLSRIGRVQTSPEPVEVAPLVEEIAMELRSSAPSASVEVGELPVLYVNRLRARQLFMNLLGNSIRYGGHDVRIRVTGVPGPEGRAEISVHDDGPGIPVEHRTRVFGVFERLQAGDREGTGIGLSIAKRIVESVGGTIWIADSDEGLDIRFTLPTFDAEAGTEPRAQAVGDA